MNIFVVLALTTCLTISKGKLLKMEMFGQQYLYFFFNEI